MIYLQIPSEILLNPGMIFPVCIRFYYNNTTHCKIWSNNTVVGWSIGYGLTSHSAIFQYIVTGKLSNS